MCDCDEKFDDINIERRLETYRTIFGHEWSQTAYEAAKGTKLKEPLMALCVNWKAAANNHTFPWIMMHSLNHFWHSFAKTQGLLPKFINALADKLHKRVGGNWTVTQRQNIARETRDIAAEITRAWGNDPDTEVEPEVLWQGYLDNPKGREFQFAVWGSQQLVFCALFFAYERFVATLVGLGNGKDEYNKPWQKIVEDAKALFDPIDPEIAKTCVDGDFVEITRLTRNCLAHRGGKESEELKTKNHGIPLSPKRKLQIMSVHNEHCIRGLEKRVMMLIEAAKKMPKFQV